MSITDELREWKGNINTRLQPETVLALRSELNCIADRIDAEHERAMAAAALIAGVPMTDKDMAEHGWVRLPVDADGVPIRVGDVLDECAVNTYAFLPAKVVGYHECCGEIMPIVENDGEFQVKPDCVCHYHEPTIEYVLRDVVTLCHNTWKEESPFHFYDVDDVMKSGNIAEVAAKLRLAEEDA